MSATQPLKLSQLGGKIKTCPKCGRKAAHLGKRQDVKPPNDLYVHRAHIMLGICVEYTDCCWV